MPVCVSFLLSLTLFSGFVLFVLFLFSDNDDNDNGYACLYISKERRGMNLSGSESGEDPGGSAEGKIIIRIDYVKINF